MQSVDLGTLFEKAAYSILKEAFKCWEFEVTDAKIQRSGTQHGFDLYFKIVKERVVHNLFVECKASNSFNEIEQVELGDKIAQLHWAGYPRKDFHIFFSPTRAVKYNNQQLTIEDNHWPFVIVDWMRRADSNPILDLFAAYDGSNPDITAYSEYLFREIVRDYTTEKTFAEVCNRLKNHLDRRLGEHNAIAEQADFRIINGPFWSQVQKETHSEYLHYYYTRTDASEARLREVVANEFDVRHEVLEKEFDQILRQAISEKSALIKILSKGGEGKSTFLHRIARNYCDNHTVIWLDSLECLAAIKQKIQCIEAEGALLFLLDNAAIYGRDLVEFSQKLTMMFRTNHLVMVVAEREFRYVNIEGKETFESAFNE
ncbi:MAG: hypothetical protein RW306_05435 [Geobacteraceae bacterium]|nr:hypothetical protein [Geobacteraceae bacterium]